jgi:hypothetical protein
MVHVDYAADTQSLSGIRNLSTDPGQGVVNLGGGFCEALAG